MSDTTACPLHSIFLHRLSELSIPHSSSHTCFQPSVHPWSHHSVTQPPAAQLLSFLYQILKAPSPMGVPRSDSILHTSPAPASIDVYQLMRGESEGLSRTRLQPAHRPHCGPLCPSTEWTESPLPSFPPETACVPSPLPGSAGKAAQGGSVAAGGPGWGHQRQKVRRLSQAGTSLLACSRGSGSGVCPIVQLQPCLLHQIL